MRVLGATNNVTDCSLVLTEPFRFTLLHLRGNLGKVAPRTTPRRHQSDTEFLIGSATATPLQLGVLITG